MRERALWASGLYEEKEAGPEASRKALRGLQTASHTCGEGQALRSWPRPGVRAHT